MAMIQVEVTFCAWLDNAFGNGKSSVTLQESLGEGATFADLLHQLTRRYPTLKDSIVDPITQQLHDHIIAILNGKFLDLVGGMEARLGDGEEVQILPCLPGG